MVFDTQTDSFSGAFFGVEPILGFFHLFRKVSFLLLIAEMHDPDVRFLHDFCSPLPLT